MQRLTRISFYSVLRLKKHCRTLFSTPGLLYSDPWPLPHTPEHMLSTVTPRSAGNPIPPLPRDNESLETLRARLVYQSRKRGTLECDLLLSTFADVYLAGMSIEELKEYDQVCPICP
jgi:succinate dehydrogenase assembly factor 2